jgi:hypothetical protein
LLTDQATAAAPSHQDPFRRARADIISALDDFSASEMTSRRAFAQQQGIPQATFSYRARSHSPDCSDPVDSFFRSAAGESVLRRIVLAALCTFHLEGACGIRQLGDFLDLSGLNRFVASSRGALHPLAAHVEADLVAFSDEEQPSLVEQMKPKTATLILDEHFHGTQVCLVGVEPLSNFILVEAYRPNRDADTWKQAIEQGTLGMPLSIIQITSDQAAALICCAEKGLHAAHSPDLFHGQHDLLKPILPPLQRPIQKAEKELEKIKHSLDKLDGPVEEPFSEEDFDLAVQLLKQEQALQTRLQVAKEHKDTAVQQVKGLGDDYHPFDRESGKALTADEAGQRLHEHLDKLAGVLDKAQLSEKAREAVDKSHRWVGTLMGCVAWFRALAASRVEELDLSEEQEQSVYDKLLAGHYRAMAADRARTADERKRLREMAQSLVKEAWQEGGVLASLTDEERKEVQAVARQIAGCFQRSSSCVEGRNGRLSLQHHGHSRVSERRLKALTVLHNYLVKRHDGTTAAQRFFGQKHTDLFSWLLQRLLDLPRPAPKRPKQAGESLPGHGGPV